MTLKTIEDQYYGDETRWFVGVVEDINDPLKQGRVRVRVFGVHSANHNDIPQSALPWAQCVAPVTHGGTSGINGTPVGIKPYAQVFGMFLDGKHSQIPLVLGSIPRVDGPNPIVSGGRGSVVHGQVPNTTADNVHNGAGRPANSMIFEGGSNTEKTYNLLEEGFRLDMGLKNSRELAAGFVGNFIIESDIRKSDVKHLAFNGVGGNYGANGIAQWRGGRYLNLIKYASGERAPLEKNSGGNDVPSLKIQAAFVLHEIGGGDSYETSLFNRFIKNQTTARHAASAVEAYYERHEANLREKPYEYRIKASESIKARVDKAAEVYSAYANRRPQGVTSNAI